MRIILKVVGITSMLGIVILVAYKSININPKSNNKVEIENSSIELAFTYNMRLDSALKQITMELGSQKFSAEELLRFKSYFNYFGPTNKNSILRDYKILYDSHYKEHRIKIYYKNESYTLDYLGRFDSLEIFRINEYGLLIYNESLKNWLLFCSTYDAMFTIAGYVHCVFLLNRDLTVKSAFKLGMTKPGLVFEKYQSIKPEDKYLKVTKCFVSNIKFNSLTYNAFMELLNSASSIGNCEEFNSIVAPYFQDSPLWTDKTLFLETQL
jgi:hypothetical protein